MNITEKAAYLKGLAEGLSLDPEKPETKLMNAIIDLLDDIAYDVKDLEEVYDELSEQVDEIDQDLADVEEELYDEDCDCCDDDDDFDEDDDEFYEDEENPFYEVTCDACGQKLRVAEDVLLEGEIECPNCGEVLEFDFSDLFDDEDFDCDGECEGCSGCDEPEEE